MSCRNCTVLAIFFLLPGFGVATGKDAEPAAPATLAEGIARLEKVLGKYDTNQDQQEWRIPEKNERKSRPKAEEAEILDTFDGMKIVGLPFTVPAGIAFDEVLTWKRQVFDLGEGDKRKLTRAQTSHNVSRYTIRFYSGEWLVQAQMLSNGVHESVGSPTYQGAVKWHSDGFEFIGSFGVGRYYGAGGKLILGTAYGSTRYIRNGDKLTIKTKVQPYHLAVDAEGVTTVSPDFKRPLGSIFEDESTSEPRAAGK